MVQLSHLYMTTRKTIALTIQTTVGKVTSQPFNTLSRIVIVFLPGTKCLNFMAAEIWSSPGKLEPKEIKTVTVSLFPYLFNMK